MLVDIRDALTYLWQQKQKVYSFVREFASQLNTYEF
jgi:hypothetical protein